MSPGVSARGLGWGWALKVRVLGGTPTRELYEEARAAGESAVPLLVDILSRREFREGEPADCAPLPTHAMRLLGDLRAESAIPALVNVLCDPVDPAQHAEEAALALARIGTPAIAPLEGVLKDTSRGTWVRAYAAQALTYVALADRRHRGRVRASLERILLDARETDRVLNANIALDACSMAMLVLLPAIEVAYQAGRVEEDVVELDAVRLELAIRHQRPDRDAKAAVVRDVCEDYVTWADMTEGMADVDRRRLETAFARIDREGAAEPRPDDLDAIFADAD